MDKRIAVVRRTTKETEIELELILDGSGEAKVDSGLGFLDHLLTSLARHARFDLKLKCRGDLQIDDHHTAEDCALVLGSAIDEALGDRSGIARFGYAYAPMDEAMARAVVDLSGRPYSAVDMGLKRDSINGLACENIPHVIASIAIAARMTVHVDVFRGLNDHHRAEAAFKALALAIRHAIARDGSTGVPSTKGVL